MNDGPIHMVGLAARHALLKSLRDPWLPLPSVVSAGSVETPGQKTRGSSTQSPLKGTQRDQLMEDRTQMQEEARVLRWGGLAGVLGSIVYITQSRETTNDAYLRALVGKNRDDPILLAYRTDIGQFIA